MCLRKFCRINSKEKLKDRKIKQGIANMEKKTYISEELSRRALRE